MHIVGIILVISSYYIMISKVFIDFVLPSTWKKTIPNMRKSFSNYFYREEILS